MKVPTKLKAISGRKILKINQGYIKSMQLNDMKSVILSTSHPRKAVDEEYILRYRFDKIQILMLISKAYQRINQAADTALLYLKYLERKPKYSDDPYEPIAVIDCYSYIISSLNYYYLSYLE